MFFCLCRGRVVYQLTLNLWRLLCLFYYAEAQLEVLKLTKHPEDCSIKARWRVKGLPFHSILVFFYKKDKNHLYRWDMQVETSCHNYAMCSSLCNLIFILFLSARTYDAFSTFYIGADGRIHCHKVEKVRFAWNCI